VTHFDHKPVKCGKPTRLSKLELWQKRLLIFIKITTIACLEYFAALIFIILRLYDKTDVYTNVLV